VFFFEGVQDMRGFTAQADRDSFIKSANGVNQIGIEFDSLLFWITEFAIGAKASQVLILKRFCGENGICLRNKTGMAWDKSKHSKCDIFRFCRNDHFLNHFGIGSFPVRMKNSGVDSETDSVAVILTTPCGFDSLVKAGCIEFVLFDCLGAIDTPGNDCLVIGFDRKEVIYICAFSKQHQEGVWHSGEEINEHRREICNVVEGERIKHFAHIETYFVKRTSGKFGYLPKHRVVVDIDFYEGMVFAVNKREIAISAAIGTAIGNGNKLVIRPTADSGAKFSIEFIYERGCLANHQSSFSGDNRLTDGAINRRRESLMFDDFNRCGWEQIKNSPGLSVFGDFSPEQNIVRRPGLCSIQN
jgi:hypothetical protein